MFDWVYCQVGGLLAPSAVSTETSPSHNLTTPDISEDCLGAQAEEAEQLASQLAKGALRGAKPVSVKPSTTTIDDDDEEEEEEEKYELGHAPTQIEPDGLADSDSGEGESGEGGSQVLTLEGHGGVIQIKADDDDGELGSPDSKSPDLQGTLILEGHGGVIQMAAAEEAAADLGARSPPVPPPADTGTFPEQSGFACGFFGLFITGCLWRQRSVRSPQRRRGRRRSCRARRKQRNLGVKLRWRRTGWRMRGQRCSARRWLPPRRTSRRSQAWTRQIRWRWMMMTSGAACLVWELAVARIWAAGR